MASITSSLSPFWTSWLSSTRWSDGAGNRRADLARFVGVGLRDGRAFGLDLCVADGDFARLAVQLEEHGAVAVRVRFADGEEFDDEVLPGSSSTVISSPVFMP
jgi:hypothetical protein